MYNIKKNTLQGKLTKSALLPEECPKRRQERIAEETGRRPRGRPRQCKTCEVSSSTATTTTTPLCRRKDTVYYIECGQCAGDYIGESKRPVNDRFGEHLQDATHNTRTTPWGEHWIEAHQQHPVTIKNISTIGHASDVIECKMLDAIHIHELKPSINLNNGYRLA